MALALIEPCSHASIYHNDDKVISETGRNLWETAGKLWTVRLAPSGRACLLTHGCLLVPDWNRGSKGGFKFKNSKCRRKPEGILTIVVLVLGDGTIRDAKGWRVHDRN